MMDSTQECTHICTGTHTHTHTGGRRPLEQLKSDLWTAEPRSSSRHDIGRENAKTVAGEGEEREGLEDNA